MLLNESTEWNFSQIASGVHSFLVHFSTLALGSLPQNVRLEFVCELVGFYIFPSFERWIACFKEMRIERL